MADDIQKRTGVKADLIEGGGGEFIVTVDGNTIFSKKEVGRFPEHSEILDQLKT